MLEDDILLGIFNCCQLGSKKDWSDQLRWCKLSHVCRRWRHLIHSSSSHLGTHIICTNGAPIVDTLDHLPSLPLFIDYRIRGGLIIRRNGISLNHEEDKLGIYHALQLRDRVRHINLRVSHSTLDEFLRLMDKPFPILEHLSLSFTAGDMTSLTLSKSFLAPNLRHLSLLGIRLPKRLQLLSSTLSLVALSLTNMQASAYIRPRLLAARLESLPQLEELSIEFSIPIPRPSAERLLLGKQGTPVMLANLKSFTFQGVSTYLERLISQIRAPVLMKLNITLFNQLAFTLAHLSHFINITEQIKFPRTATICFEPDMSITLSHVMREARDCSDSGFTLKVMCKSLDWQIDCAAQICGALMLALSGTEKLIINRRLSESNSLLRAMGLLTEEDETDDTIDPTTWHELLRLFVSVKELHTGHRLSVELSRALEVGEIGLDPGLLPDLQDIVSYCHGENRDSLFRSFIHARQVAGRPVSCAPFPTRA